MKKLALITGLFYSFLLTAQSITQWTEQDGTLGLGYPVPIPVDTPEPFDGFRTYAGLFSKHQSIALENPNVTGHIVGQTRNGRNIWAYVLSDENNLTKYGVKEGVMMINGGIHAREWQSPELLTGIIELLHENSNDESLHQYLLENTMIITIPVNNVDGFLQTQRFPTQNWLGSDPGFPNTSPRDGRMRRKNMFQVDEDINTQNDHLLGVDLNRNNAPFWATTNNSSSSPSSIVYHGVAVDSEPETLARLAAANLAAEDQFRVYTDAHSFSRLFFSVRTFNSQRNTLQTRLLSDFTQHHVAYPAGKFYSNLENTPGSGIGVTSEYFAYTYEIPSWTLEIEPSINGGVEYGGLSRNGHDGFILPESEIKRVREQMAASSLIVWYGQAGPPSITQLRIIDKQTEAIVFDSEWDIEDENTRIYYENSIENIIPEKDYSLLIRFDKPMRTRNMSNTIVNLQGQNLNLNPVITASIGGETVTLNLKNQQWLNEKTNNWKSFAYYQDDTFVTDFNIPAETSLKSSNNVIQWSISTTDMIGQSLDANPATVVTWAGGQWVNYEDSNGTASINGGIDSQISTPFANSEVNEFPPYVQNTALYYDPSRSGEGFSYELLSDESIWIQWFTYDDAGNQRWYTDNDNTTANVITANDILEVKGGIFGPAFDSNNISTEPFGSLEIIFSGGTQRNNPVGLHTISRSAQAKYTDLNGKKLRTNFVQLSLVQGIASDLTLPLPTPIVPLEGPAALTGSWYDPQRSGEGYILQILENDVAILVWYTYDLTGQSMWLVDSTGIITETEQGTALEFNNVLVAEGGIFGEDFNSNDITFTHWGTIQFNLNCTTGTVNFSSALANFGDGTYNIIKLTNPAGNTFSCEE